MRDTTGKVKRRKRRRRPGEIFFRDRVEYALLRLAACLVRALPIETASTLMGKGWRAFGPLTARDKRALTNLSAAFPKMPEPQRRAIASDQWESLGRTFAESFVTDRIVADPDRITLSISDALEAKLAQPGGLVVVGMHSANWEIATFSARRFRSVAGLYRALANPLADAFVARQRSHVFDGGLFAKGPDSANRIMQWVRDGNAAAMLGDQLEGRGVAVTMFGLPTLANPFPAMVARRLGVPLIAGRPIRLPGSRFRMEAIEIPVPVSDDAQADVKAATQAVQDCFEVWIRDRPGEWMWVQDRWSIGRERRLRRRGQR